MDGSVLRYRKCMIRLLVFLHTIADPLGAVGSETRSPK